MKTVSQEFKDAARASIKEVGARITIYDNERQVVYTDQDQIQSIAIESAGELFGSEASQVTVKLVGTGYDLLDKQFLMEYLLKVGDNYEPLQFGVFVVTECPQNKEAETTTIKAISRMGELQNTPYSEMSGFPMTIKQMAQALANQFGLTLENMDALPNVGYVITEELYSKITNENYRNILAEIAGATGTMAIIDDNNQTLRFRPSQFEVQGHLDYNSLKSLKVGEKYGPVSSVVLARTPQEDNVAVVDQEMARVPAGKNKWCPPADGTYNGVTITNNADGTLNIQGTPTANVNVVSWISLPYLGIKNGEVCTFVATKPIPSGTTVKFEAYNGNTWLNHVLTTTLTPSNGSRLTASANIPDTTTRVRCALYFEQGIAVNVQNIGFQVVKGNQTKNLYHDLSTIKDSNIWTSDWAWNLTGESYEGHQIIKRTAQWNGANDKTALLKPNTQYTVSCFARSANGATVSGYNTAPTGGTRPTPGYKDFGVLTNEWRKLSFTFTTVEGGDCRPRFEITNSGTSLEICALQLELGNKATDYEPYVIFEPYKENGIQEVKLANNEIMDDEREVFAQPLLDAVKGWNWHNFELTTTGLGWIDCGDRIEITTDTGETVEGIVTYHSLTVDGGVKEVVKGIAPTPTSTNYALAGGIEKTIYNTQIKVDKQNQQIESIVQEQATLEGKVNDNYTQIVQNITNVVTSVQNSGGNNLIKNSAFYSKDPSGSYLSWSTSSLGGAYIPEEYQPVAYLESTTTQYIRMPFSLDSSLTIETMFSLNSLADNVPIYCSREGSNTRTSTLWFITANKHLRFDYNTATTEVPGDIAVNTIYKTTAVQNKFYVNDVLKTTPAAATFTTPAQTTLFASANGTGTPSTMPKPMKLYYFKTMSNSGLVTHCCVPCIRKEDRVAGVYDAITNTFYTNAGTGEFKTGQPVLPNAYPSSEATTYGSLSGQAIALSGMKISQSIPVSADDESIPEDFKIYYSFSCRVKKSASDIGSITITDGTESGVWTIDLPNGTASTWGEYSIEGILPNSTNLTITAQSNSGSTIELTDSMLGVGNYRSNWTQANGEFANTQVTIDTNGVTVSSNNLAGSYTKTTPQEVEVYENNQLKTVVNSGTVSAPVITATKEFDMPPIKIVPQSDGWAFVPTQ